MNKMAKKSLKDIPLQEITLRKYEIPTALDDRELARKFLLSIGMLQPGDSRDIVVDIFHYLLVQQKSSCVSPVLEDQTQGRVDKGGKAPYGATFEQLSAELEGKPGASQPNIRRQLRRLKEIKLIDSRGDAYRIVESGQIAELINNYLEQFIVTPTLSRIKQYAVALEQRFNKLSP